jgi:hypothetical protein
MNMKNSTLGAILIIMGILFTGTFIGAPLGLASIFIGVLLMVMGGKSR